MSGIDISVMVERWRPEPATEAEQECMKKMDLTTFEVFNHKIQLVALEGKEVMVSTGATSSLLAGDICSGLYTAQGDMAASAAGVWPHTVTGLFGIKWVLKHWKNEPSVGINDGDVFFNACSLAGAAHNMDQIVFQPIVYKGELIAWSSAVAHEPDVGAIEPGMPLSATTRYHEGELIPPIKIADNFRLREDVINMIINPSRTPRDLLLDTKAKVASCMRMRQRVLELAEKMGRDYVVGGLRMMIEEGAIRARKRLKSYPDGVYRGVAFSDSIGRDEGLYRIMMTVTKTDDKIKLDLTGTGPQVPGFINSFPPLTVGGLVLYLYNYLWPDVPPSTGVLEPLELVIPRPSLAFPEQDAAVTNGMQATTCVGQICFHPIFAKMAFDTPDRRNLAAPPCNHNRVPLLVCKTQYGTFTGGFMPEANGPGIGASTYKDGVNALSPSWACRTDSEDTETAESLFPMLYPFRLRHTKDMHGFGKFRSGAGFDSTYVVYGTDWFTLTCQGIFGRITTPGLFGGYGSTSFPQPHIINSNLLEMMNNSDENIPTNLQQVIIEKRIKGEYIVYGPNVPSNRVHKEGNVLTTAMGGGGGYGDVLERDPDLVMKDIRQELISDWVAKNVYHLAYDPKSLIVDYEKTEELRVAEKERRKQRGRPYEEFEKDWLKKRPPARALKYYGTWPDAHPL